MTRLSVWVLFVLSGMMRDMVGRGYPTVRMFCSWAVPPPGGEFVTVTVRTPMAALSRTVTCATIWDALVNVSESMMIPAPIPTEVTVSMKFEPVSVILTFSPRRTTSGETLAREGGGFALIPQLTTAPPLTSVRDEPACGDEEIKLLVRT